MEFQTINEKPKDYLVITEDYREEEKIIFDYIFPYSKVDENLKGNVGIGRTTSSVDATPSKLEKRTLGFSLN